TRDVDEAILAVLVVGLRPALDETLPQLHPVTWVGVACRSALLELPASRTDRGGGGGRGQGHDQGDTERGPRGGVGADGSALPRRGDVHRRPCALGELIADQVI